MDRQIVYTGQIPLDTDMLSTNKDAYIGLAKLTAGVLGTSTLLNAFTCIPTAPASLQVQVTAGEIYSLQNIDNNAYGSLAADTTHQIVKQGVVLNTTTLNCPAPGTSGQSINYLIQIGFSETDGGSTVLPYYNSSNPAQPYSGPSNSGQPNNTIRQDGINIQAKAGVAATTGTQTTPSPDTGFTGAFVVTVANGQTQINSGNITTYSGAPFILETLTQKISQSTADARYAQQTQVQSGLLLYGIDTSVSANTITANLSPALTSYGTGGMLFYIKIANTNTGASTVNLNSLGAKNIKLINGSNPVPGDMVGGGESVFLYDGTNVQLLNPASATAYSIQNGGFNYTTDTGTANAYVGAYTPALTSYTNGARYFLKIANPNTGASTANFNALGAKNITYLNGTSIAQGALVAGMIAEFGYDGTNLQLFNPAANTAVLPLFQCQLVLTNSTTLTLNPYNGNIIFINGGAVTIPSAGVTVTTSGLSASTFYYIYAYLNSGTLTLEAVATAPTTNTTYGYQQKTGDATRTLVGAVYTDASIHFNDSATNRTVLSYYNRSRKHLSNTFTANRSTNSLTFVELNSEIRCNFIMWGDEAVPFNLLYSNVTGSTTAGFIYYVAIAFNSTTSPSLPLSTVFDFASSTNTIPTLSASAAIPASSLITGGLNFMTLIAESTSGSATVTIGPGSTATPTNIGGAIRG